MSVCLLYEGIQLYIEHCTGRFNVPILPLPIFCSLAALFIVHPGPKPTTKTSPTLHIRQKLSALGSSEPSLPIYPSRTNV